MIVAVVMISLTIIFVFSFLLPCVKAPIVEISSISPDSHRGEVGEEIRIVGTLNTTDGSYRVLFGSMIVNVSSAIGNDVDATFRAPSLPKGNYTITLQDDETKENDTTWFVIETAYFITPVLPVKPEQLQQNDSVRLNLEVTGGSQDSTFQANVTVELPSPLDASTYSTVLELTTNSTGYGNANVTYPDETLFDPFGSHTNYAGYYIVYFNKTQNLDQSSFFIGLTDRSEYHRKELVTIKAVGYQVNETANITITSLETNRNWTLPPTNASIQGIINAMWVVPSNASIGYYNITMSAENTTKPVADSQLIRVPGYPIRLFTQNLAGDNVPKILVEALDVATNSTYSNRSRTDGLTYLSLEEGNHTLEAFWNDVKVNKTQLDVIGRDTYNLTCELTNMKITVEDNDGNRIPFTHLNISYHYVTTKGNLEENGSMTGETSVSGVFLLNSTLPRIDYNINASRYGVIFNRENNTVEDLPALGQFNATIVCPAQTLTLNITDHYENQIANANVEMIEQMGGISYEKATDVHGTVSINCTFGKYSVRIYKDDLLLNETFVTIFNDTNIMVHCKLCNLTISLKILDYFGQLIPVTNVTVLRDGFQYLPSSKSAGVTEFSNIVGGDLQVTVYLHEQTQPWVVRSFYVDRSTTIEIRMPKYVLLAGLLVETSQLTTALIIVLAVILIFSVEIYRRKHSTPETS